MSHAIVKLRGEDILYSTLATLSRIYGEVFLIRFRPVSYIERWTSIEEVRVISIRPLAKINNNKKKERKKVFICLEHQSGMRAISRS